MGSKRSKSEPKHGADAVFGRSGLVKWFPEVGLGQVTPSGLVGSGHS